MAGLTARSLSDHRQLDGHPEQPYQHDGRCARRVPESNRPPRSPIPVASSSKSLRTLASLLIAAIAVLFLIRWQISFPEDHTSPGLDAPFPESTTSASDWLTVRERAVENTSWSKEMLAQECAQTFESLWNAINTATNKLALLADFEVGELVLGRGDTVRNLPHGIVLKSSTGVGPTLPQNAWREQARSWAQAGWKLATIEFRHTQFETETNGLPWRSHFQFSAHLERKTPAERAVLAGDLEVDWHSSTAMAGPAKVGRIDASNLTLATRQGEPPFHLVLNAPIQPPAGLFAIDPLLVQDLDGDGRMEILLPAVNLRYRMDDQGVYQASRLLPTPPARILAGVLADVDADGVADLLVARAEGLWLFSGTMGGAFQSSGRWVWSPPEPLVNPMVLACGDGDGDGSVDVFLGQYKVPTLGQIIRPHYYEANDGHPCYLLWNDGTGHFQDATVSAGLEKKRGRRVYSASWVDLDDDADLDLVVNADFAGADLYRNNGSGHFTDVTDSWVAESHAFGMSHTLADFNVDGRLDLLIIGMNSPTADRLEHLKLWRPDAKEDRTMRARMTYGNRLYLGRPGGGFDPSPMGASIARSGWSWGSGTLDCDNDGFPDVYIANGFESKATVKDYEQEFWLHDIYVDDTVDDLTATAYFLGKYQRTRGQGWSYGGYEKNRLYWNDQGRAFVEIGHLFGLALEEDSRCVVANDLDGDGRVDLAIITTEVWPEARHTLRLYRNTLESTDHWIGFRVAEGGAGRSPIGVQVTLHQAERRAVRSIVTGDSFRCQHGSVVHFGLGLVDRVERAVIRWPGGASVVLENPAVDRYHTMQPTGAAVRR